MSVSRENKRRLEKRKKTRELDRKKKAEERESERKHRATERETEQKKRPSFEKSRSLKKRDLPEVARNKLVLTIVALCSQLRSPLMSVPFA